MHHETYRWATLLGVAILVAPTGAAAAEDTPWRLADRSLDFQAGADGFELTSRRPDGPADVLRASWSAARAGFSYHLAVPGAEPADVWLDATLVSLQEFRDRDGDGRLGPADQQVQRVPIAALPATSIPQATGDGSFRVTTTYRVPANGTAGPLPIGNGLPPPGTLVVAWMAVARPTAVDGAVQDPLQVRMDLHVQDFPFKAEDTLLALEAGVASGSGLRADARAAVSAVGPYVGSFRWGDGAATSAYEKDGVTTQLVTLPRASSGNAHGAFMAQRFPVAVDAASVAAPPGNPVLYASALGLAVLVVGVPALARLRRPHG